MCCYLNCNKHGVFLVEVCNRELGIYLQEGVLSWLHSWTTSVQIAWQECHVHLWYALDFHSQRATLSRSFTGWETRRTEMSRCAEKWVTCVGDFIQAYCYGLREIWFVDCSYSMSYPVLASYMTCTVCVIEPDYEWHEPLLTCLPLQSPF